jgi:DsbC/DsbD-like thiol-disulfide interchange protein
LKEVFMRTDAPILRAVFFSMLFASAALAQQPAQELVTAKVIADTSGIKAGMPFTIAVLLKVEPHWHVYWHNPGDSGRATTVNFTVPKGFEVGPLQYPVPIKFKQPGDVIGYGYEGDVLLTARVTPPAKLQDSSRVTIAADVRWLCCRDVCVPGRAKLALALPVQNEPTAANKSVFDDWARRFPLDNDRNVKYANWEVDAAAGTFTHAVEWTKAPGKVEIYPGRHDAIEVQQTDVQTDDGVTRATLKLRVRPGMKLDVTSLPALIVYWPETGEKGAAKPAVGINVKVPLESLAPRNARAAK